MKRTKLGVISLILVSLWASSPFIGEAKEQKGFVGYWKFDEGSGKKAIDSSNHENHGMIKGKPKWVKGQFGKALDLMVQHSSKCRIVLLWTFSIN